MRGFVLLLMWTMSFASPAMAAKRVSVEELEHLLSAAHGESDGKVAKDLSNLELTDRVSSVRLAHWENEFPGRHCHDAFTVLADAAAFLDLPAADISADAPPDLQTQKAMLARTVDYVNSTIHKLPNFYATRRTEHFEDLPAPQNSSNKIPGKDPGVVPKAADFSHASLHGTGNSSATVSYVDGEEVLGSKKGTDSSVKPSLALTTHGEFGPILIAVLVDAVKAKMYWEHWEKGERGNTAVFRYTVPQRQSSYQVMLPHVAAIESPFTAYHGEIAVDPATGAILRVTFIADLAYPNQQAISSIMVEYGPVSIGGNSYICPFHSVALARFIPGNPLAPEILWQTQLNDVAFVDYHQFRTESRVLTDSAIGAPEPPAPPK